MSRSEPGGESGHTTGLLTPLPCGGARKWDAVPETDMNNIYVFIEKDGAAVISDGTGGYALLDDYSQPFVQELVKTANHVLAYEQCCKRALNWIMSPTTTEVERRNIIDDLNRTIFAAGGMASGRVYAAEEAQMQAFP